MLEDKLEVKWRIVQILGEIYIATAVPVRSTAAPVKVLKVSMRRTRIVRDCDLSVAKHIAKHIVKLHNDALDALSRGKEDSATQISEGRRAVEVLEGSDTAKYWRPGIFLGFYQKGDHDGSTQPVAIIEYEDGTVSYAYLSMIRFKNNKGKT